MKTKLITTGLILGALMAPLVGHTADSDADRSDAKAYVKDSAITTKVKAKLAADKQTSAIHIKVDTDDNGVVSLSGTAKSQAESDRAAQIASSTEGVKSVNNNIQIKTN